MAIQGDILGPLLGALQQNKQRDLQREQFQAQQQQLGIQAQQQAESRGLQNQLVQQQIAAGKTSGQAANEKLRLQLQDVVPIAKRLKTLSDPNKLLALQNERQRRQDAGIDFSIVQQGIQQAESGDFEGLNRDIDQIIARGQKLTGERTKVSAPVQTIDPITGEVGLAFQVRDEQGSRLEPIDLKGKKLTAETPESKRQAIFDAAIATKEAELLVIRRQDIATEIGGNAMEARRRLARLNKTEEAFKAFETGKFAQGIRLIGGFVPGVDPSDEQALQADINSFVIEMASALPGSLSEKELDFIQAATVSLGVTKEANLMILKRMKETQKRLIEEQDQFKKFKKGGGKAEDFEVQFADRKTFDEAFQLKNQMEQREKLSAATKNFSAEKLSTIQKLRDLGLSDGQILEGMDIPEEK